MEHEAKRVIGEYFDRLLNQRDLSVCDELLSPEYVDHDAGPGAVPGPDETKAYVEEFLLQHPDMRVEVKDVLSEGDKVAVRLRWEGTNSATGEACRKDGIIILRLDADGRIAERWSAYS